MADKLGMSESLKSLGKEDLLAMVQQLLARVSALEAEVGRLRQENVNLKEQVVRLKKDSSNSSKPPSSDIVKPPRPGSSGQKRKIGGQPGHPRHERRPFPPDQVDDIQHHTLDRCPDCHGKLVAAEDAGKVIQQVELVDKPIIVTEHRAASYRCDCCGKEQLARMPGSVECGGLLGPGLTALVAHLKGACHCSYTTIQGFMKDVLGLEVSTGMLVKTTGKASAALAASYAELAAALPHERRLNVDETGHKNNGKAHWTWCFRAADYAVFKIAGSRGSEVLKEVLGKGFKGVLCCDYYSAYRKYQSDFDTTVQFCLAHLIRDVRYLVDLPDRVTQRYGRKVLKKLKKLFTVWHKREGMEADRFFRALESARDELICVAKSAPQRGEAQNIARRFRDHGRYYFTFIQVAGVEPTNNAAEQAIRFLVIDRKVTQGTRSETGQRWCERIWTTLATCAQQTRSAFRFIAQAVENHFNNRLAPSLLHVGP